MPRCWVTIKELFARAGVGSTKGGLGRSPGGYPRPGHALPERVAGRHEREIKTGFSSIAAHVSASPAPPSAVWGKRRHTRVCVYTDLPVGEDPSAFLPRNRVSLNSLSLSNNRGRTAAASSSSRGPSTDWRNGSASDSSPEGCAFESRIGHWTVARRVAPTVHPQARLPQQE